MFDAARFSRLAKAHWAEHRRAYAWFIGIGIMVHFVLLLAVMSGKNGFSALASDGQSVFYFLGLYTTAPIFAARYFQQMSARESALLVLMRPASALEKWLLAFMFVAIAYPLVYTLAFYVCNIPAWLIAKAQMQQALQLAIANDATATGYGMLDPDRYKLFFVLNEVENKRGLIAIGLSLASFQAFAVLGSLYFRAMPFIKTILAAFLILLLVIGLVAVFESRPDVFFGYWQQGSHMLTQQQRALYPVAWAGVPILLWLSCLLALREREVA